MTGGSPVQVERDGPLAIVTHGHRSPPSPTGAQFDTQDLRGAVTSFLEHGPGRATSAGN